jgi:uncharacterized protein (DUF1800 family)
MMLSDLSRGFGVVVALMFAAAGPAGLDAQMRNAAQPAAAVAAADEEAARTAHLLSRATWGLRAGDVEAVLAAGGRTSWLERQLQPHAIADAVLSPRLDAFATTRMSMSDLYRDFSPNPQQLAEQQRMQALRDSLGDAAVLQAMTSEMRAERQARNPARLLNELVAAKIQRSVYSERQLEEVMTDFWFNHFNVFFNKGQVRYLIGDYERNAIRPHVFGRFEDMLRATAQHPAMLFYLDNWQSVHADTAARAPQPLQNVQQLMRRVATMSEEQKRELVRSGRITEAQLAQLQRGEMPVLQQVAQRMQNRGLNENYARELLELHTLGVDGGYTQQDVIEVARAFTGWTFLPYNARQPNTLQQIRSQQATPPRGAAPGRMRAGAQQRGPAPAAPYIGDGDVPFLFRPDMHDRGDKVVLGHTIAAGRGMEDGLDVLSLLARHPSTARHIATKLVERFVSDDPPADLVNHIAEEFLRTDGDLRAVTRALFTADAFYRPEHRLAKVKTPYELVVSALRATGAEVGQSQRTVQLLRTMGHLPYSEPAPTGFPAMSEDWINTGAMLNRMNFGLDLAAGRVDGVRLDVQRLMQQAGRPAAAAARDVPLPLDAMLNALLPGRETERLAERIREDVAAQGAMQPRQRVARAFGLVLGSPEFQRH